MQLIKDESFITIQGWMINKLGLSGTKLIVYATIYGFTNGTSNHCYKGGASYLGEWCGLGKRQIYRILNELVDEGKLYKHVRIDNNVTYVDYFTNNTPETLLQEPEEEGDVKMSPGGGHNVTGVVSKCHQGDDIMSPHIYIDNSIDINKENNNKAETVQPDKNNVSVPSKLDKKKNSKQTKQKRQDEILNNKEWNDMLHASLDITEIQHAELDNLRKDYIELRCKKGVSSLTDGAVVRNLKVLAGTSFEDRYEIINNSVVGGWTGLFPLKKKSYSQQNNNYALKNKAKDLAEKRYNATHGGSDAEHDVIQKEINEMLEKYGDEFKGYFVEAHNAIKNKNRIKI